MVIIGYVECGNTMTGLISKEQNLLEAYVLLLTEVCISSLNILCML